VVALSQLVLGVYFPSDVLAAICLGVLIPLVISMAIDLYQQRLAITCMHAASSGQDAGLN